MQIQHRSRAPGVPWTPLPHVHIHTRSAAGPDARAATAPLDSPAPGRLKCVLNKAHLHLGDLLPDPLRVALTPVASPTFAAAASCCVWCTIKNDLAVGTLACMLGARAPPSVDGAVARAFTADSTQDPALCETAVNRSLRFPQFSGPERRHQLTVEKVVPAQHLVQLYWRKTVWNENQRS